MTNDDKEYEFQITCRVTGQSEVDAFRMLSPALDALRLLDVKRSYPTVELVAERPVWSSTISA